MKLVENLPGADKCIPLLVMQLEVTNSDDWSAGFWGRLGPNGRPLSQTAEFCQEPTWGHEQIQVVYTGTSHSDP